MRCIPAASDTLIANIVLAATGIVALFLVAAYGHDVVVEERVLYALSHRRLGGGGSRPRASVALTSQKTEVLVCLCEGLGTDHVAGRLAISRHSAVTHIRDIMKKLGVSSRADAVVWAVQHGLPEAASRAQRFGDLDPSPTTT